MTRAARTQAQLVLDELSRSRWTPTEALVDRLFGHRLDGGPDDAERTVRVVVSRVRSSGFKVSRQRRYYLENRIDETRFLDGSSIQSLYRRLAIGPASADDLIAAARSDNRGMRVRLSILRRCGAEIRSVSGYVLASSPQAMAVAA